MVVAADSDEDRKREVEHILVMPKTTDWRSFGGKGMARGRLTGSISASETGSLSRGRA